LPAGVTKNNFRNYGYASDFSFSQRPKYLRPVLMKLTG
jgi:hypothetical protein